MVAGGVVVTLWAVATFIRSSCISGVAAAAVDGFDDVRNCGHDMEIDVGVVDSVECMVHKPTGDEGDLTCVPTKIWPWGWIAPKRPGTSKMVGAARTCVISGQMYKKVLFLEQMSEVLQRVAKIPRERIESIERGVQGNVIQGNVTFLSDKELVRSLRWPTDSNERGKVSLAGKHNQAWGPRQCEVLSSAQIGMDSPKATWDVEDSGNSEDLQRMDSFIRRCLRGIKSVVEIIGGQMYKKVLFAEQKLEVLKHAAESLRKQNDVIEKRSKKSELGSQGRKMVRGEHTQAIGGFGANVGSLVTCSQSPREEQTDILGIWDNIVWAWRRMNIQRYHAVEGVGKVASCANRIPS
ncbi:hypothetical protein EDB86DRAFT_2833500 [Lactarius hatsudake]|nr:hypothetical protein EDB86DRAFT_2833500 [Lactarius hatsudake]